MIRGEADIPAWALWSDAGRARAVDGRRRGGGDAARPGDVAPRLALRGRARRAARSSIERAAAETHGSALELATDPHADVADADRRAGALRAGLARRARAARAARRRRGHAPARALGGRRGLARRALPVPATPRCASWRAASRPSGCTCTSPCPTRSAVRALQPHARAPADAARAVGATRRSGRAATPAWPRCARRSSRPSRASASRAVRLLRRLRRGDRRAAALRRDPRADVPLVGRAAAAAASARSRCA